MSKYIKTPAYVDSMPVDISFVFADERPAGKHGFLKVDGEDFRFEDGSPGRFWGVCMNGAACFPSHDYAEKVSDRLAMAGINCVRFHQLDGEYHTPNIFQFRKGERLKSTRAFDPKSMARLEYFAKCLKERGIYIYLDMMVFRHFKSGDGVACADELYRLGEYCAKPYSIFDPVMIDLQKEYATNLWNHYNPYTELAYKDDPVFILSEITNENDIWIQGHRSTDKKPFVHIKYYEDELRQLLRDWLKDNEADVDPETVDVWDMENAALNRFKLDLTYRYNRTMYEHIRSLGVKCPLTASNRLRNVGFN
ncbi:MAG: hypothetical protein J6Z79_00810, partial [Clostridia bacterium]|nr:hypothetical protein [Clostridia bacterium]